MTFPEFDPVLIHLGPLPIRWYALTLVALRREDADADARQSSHQTPPMTRRR